jgi:hypothetical protein
MITREEFLKQVNNFCTLTGTARYEGGHFEAIFHTVQKKGWNQNMISAGLKRISQSAKSTHRNLYGELCGAIDGEESHFPGGQSPAAVASILPRDQWQASIRKQNAFMVLVNILLRIKPYQTPGWYEAQIDRWTQLNNQINIADYPPVGHLDKQTEMTDALTAEYCGVYKVQKVEIKRDNERNAPEEMGKAF